MKKLAPNITRQRLLIEGFYNINVDKSIIENYFNEITDSLKLRMYGKPIIFSPRDEGKEENQGYWLFRSNHATDFGVMVPLQKFMQYYI